MSQSQRPPTSSSAKAASGLSFTSSVRIDGDVSFDDDENASDIEPNAKRQDRDENEIQSNPNDNFLDHVCVIRDEEQDSDEKVYMIRLLSRRAMHLPNMNWAQDWLQYMKNNHPLFGICLRHPLHPLKIPNRLYLLLASTSFGLAATNCVYLYYALNDDEMDKILVKIVLEKDSPLNFKEIEALEITYGMVTLWTFGGILHTLFDICMWYLSACACFLSGASCSRKGKYQLIGSYIVIAVAAVLVALALFVVLMRAAYDRRLRLAEQGIVLEDFEWEEFGRIRNFSFLLGYLIELTLVYFAYYPLLISVGFFGCVPFIGREKEMKKQYRERISREQGYRERNVERGERV
jgi:hypothetical protein